MSEINHTGPVLGPLTFKEGQAEFALTWSKGPVTVCVFVEDPASRRTPELVIA